MRLHVRRPGGQAATAKGKCVSGSTFNGLSTPAKSTASTLVPVCMFNCTNENGTNIIFGFHPGSGGVCMCDGSAHMLSENIGFNVLWDLMTFRGLARGGLG